MVKSKIYPQCYMTWQWTWHRQTNKLFITYWCFHGYTHPMLPMHEQKWANGYLQIHFACQIGHLWHSVNQMAFGSPESLVAQKMAGGKTSQRRPNTMKIEYKYNYIILLVVGRPKSQKGSFFIFEGMFCSKLLPMLNCFTMMYSSR